MIPLASYLLKIVSEQVKLDLAQPQIKKRPSDIHLDSHVTLILVLGYEV